MFTRRSLLQGAALIAVVGAVRPTFAADAPVPIVFVHGDSDQAAIWQTAIWRFESNGYPRDRLFAISLLIRRHATTTLWRSPIAPRRRINCANLRLSSIA
jgi:lipase (class 2)